MQRTDCACVQPQERSVQLVTRRELSDRWKLSIETLKRRERSGILSALKLGRGVRYRLEDIERLEADAEVRGRPIFFKRDPGAQTGGEGRKNGAADATPTLSKKSTKRLRHGHAQPWHRLQQPRQSRPRRNLRQFLARRTYGS